MNRRNYVDPIITERIRGRYMLNSGTCIGGPNHGYTSSYYTNLGNELGHEEWQNVNVAVYHGDSQDANRHSVYREYNKSILIFHCEDNFSEWLHEAGIHVD